MDLVGHHTPRVNGHAGRGGVGRRALIAKAATAGQAKTGAQPFTAMVIEQSTPMLASSGTASLMRRLGVLFGHKPFTGLAADGGGQAPALQTDGAEDKPLPHSARDGRKLG